jgi:hypothetical protein
MISGPAITEPGCALGAKTAHIMVQNFSQKKTLDSAQNLENKGPGKILPCRSMVLKVVTGKIF